MKVHELISALQSHDPNANVLVGDRSDAFILTTGELRKLPYTHGVDENGEEIETDEPSVLITTSA